MLYAKKSPIHGKGLYTDELIKKGEKIGTFKVVPATYETRFTIWVGNTPYRAVSILKYANSSKSPNAEVYTDLTMWAIKDIKPGCEITWAYGDYK